MIEAERLLSLSAFCFASPNSIFLLQNASLRRRRRPI